MCGIFGAISTSKVSKACLSKLVSHSRQRGKDSSGFITYNKDNYIINRSDSDIVELFKKIKPYNNKIVFGHSRLVTNGLSDNQPVLRNGNVCLHNGIIVNESEIWANISSSRQLQIDSEVIIALTELFLDKDGTVEDLASYILSVCKGVVACALILPKIGKLVLFSNNGSLYTGYVGNDFYFASESYGLRLIGCSEITQIKGTFTKILDIPNVKTDIVCHDLRVRNENLIPEFNFVDSEAKLLQYNTPIVRRCKKCVLPETMPFITFDENGVCNYCINYRLRNTPKPKEDLFKLLENYRRKGNELDCIVPFSGGRDSCYGLHLIVNELKMKPITYTYDWGMVTDLGRRNISRICSQLGVENIIVAADISKKRRNIKMNLQAWLKSPHLGMMAMLTAGDKHFFRHVESVKKQSGISLNLWGVNPLEVTHFKTGFLGIEPDFIENRVYSHGFLKQLKYHSKRFRTMLDSLDYFNSSLWDTLSGEYYRSSAKKTDYYHIFDYWKWDEVEVNDTLFKIYDWEKAIDTTSTWRIGDGTAAFYNYVYYTVAGFTEHDTFRSNQIREGQITREVALKLLEDENKPRYQNLRWYLDTLGLDFSDVIKIVNKIPKLYNI